MILRVRSESVRFESVRSESVRSESVIVSISQCRHRLPLILARLSESSLSVTHIRVLALPRRVLALPRRVFALPRRVRPSRYAEFRRILAQAAAGRRSRGNVSGEAMTRGSSVCVCVCARARAGNSGQVCDFYGGRPAGVGRATSGQCSGFRVGPWEAVTSLGIDHGHVPSLHRSRSRPFHRSRPRVDHGHVPSVDHGHVPRPLYPHTRLAQGKYISARGCGRPIRVSCTHVVLQYAESRVRDLDAPRLSMQAHPAAPSVLRPHAGLCRQRQRSGAKQDAVRGRRPVGPVVDGTWRFTGFG